MYRASLHKRLYADDQPPDKFELPPRTVSVKVHEALTVARPKSRYKITFPTYLMAVLRRILPRRLFDNILARA